MYSPSKRSAMKLPGVEPVAGAGHYIQKDRPDAVVAAIRAVAAR